MFKFKLMFWRSLARLLVLVFIFKCYFQSARLQWLGCSLDAKIVCNKHWDAGARLQTPGRKHQPFNVIPTVLVFMGYPSNAGLPVLG